MDAPRRVFKLIQLSGDWYWRLDIKNDDGLIGPFTSKGEAEKDARETLGLRDGEGDCRDGHSTPASRRNADQRRGRIWAMCGRLRVGKGFLHAGRLGRSSHVFDSRRKRFDPPTADTEAPPRGSSVTAPPAQRLRPRATSHSR
jgi:hypothetical protein